MKENITRFRFAYNVNNAVIRVRKREKDRQVEKWREKETESMGASIKIPNEWWRWREKRKKTMEEIKNIALWVNVNKTLKGAHIRALDDMLAPHMERVYVAF